MAINEYEIIEQMFSNLKDKKTEGIRSKLNAIYKERHGSKRKTIMIKQKWYSVAATVAALIMVGAFWYSSLNNKGWNEEVFQKYYEEDEVFINTRSKVNFDVDVLHHGMELLEKKDFTQIQILDEKLTFESSVALFNNYLLKTILQ